jgi:tetratricopeptide (TPR) repeat protein
MNREKALEYLQQNNNEEAIKIYNHLIMCGSYDLDDMNSLGVAYYRNNEYNKAMVVFNELLYTNPNFIPARVNYAQIIYNECMKKRMEPCEQIKELKRAISYDPNCFIIWHALAITYIIANKQQRALTTIHMALMIDPTNIDGLVTMSKICSMGSMWYDTKNICSKILEKDSTNQYAKDEYQHAKSMIENVGAMRIRIGYIMHIDKTMHKICDGLYIGSMSAASNLDGLKQNNITHVLNVASEVPNYFENSSEIKIKYAHENLLDTCDSDILQNDQLEKCIGFITNAIESGGCVLVHCQAGMSRSGAMVVAYLMKSQNLTYDDAVAKARSIRPCVCPNIGFERQIKKYFGEISISIPVHKLTTILDCLKGSVPANIYKK